MWTGTKKIIKYTCSNVVRRDGGSRERRIEAVCNIMYSVQYCYTKISNQ